MKRPPSARELEVLRLVADGLSQQQIGAKLWIEVHTVKSHLRNLYKLLGARNAAHAVAIGYREGILP